MFHNELFAFKHRRGISCAKIPKREHTRTTSYTSCLVPLQGKPVITAPKIYENQIFRDVFDNQGNHDRVLNTSGLGDFGPKVIFQWGQKASPDPARVLNEVGNIIKIPGVHHRRYLKRVH